MLLASAVLTVNSLFLLALAVFMLMAVTTFILFEMKRTFRQSGVHAPLPPARLGHASMFRSIASTSPGLVLLILLGASAIFFLLPRVSSGYLNNYVPRDDISTGFSNEVELGRIGEIQQSRSLVMHVRIAGDNKGDFDGKWRGVSLSLFLGQRWSNLEAKHLVPRLSDGSFALAGASMPASRPLLYRVFMEPISSNVFFLAARARSLTGNYRALALDGGGSVSDLDAEHPVSTYEASADLAVPNREQLRRASVDYPPEVLLNDLQLPRLDPRIPLLAAAITRGSDNNYDRAAVLEGYLRTHFAYTLQLSRSVPKDPLAEFLFVRKQGHCEYFASSMAVMLRTLRIPARVVNGFDTGEFNDLTSEYVVRASDAHSWVEAYYPGYGWVSFPGLAQFLESSGSIPRRHAVILAGMGSELRFFPPDATAAERGAKRAPAAAESQFGDRKGLRISVAESPPGWGWDGARAHRLGHQDLGNPNPDLYRRQRQAPGARNPQMDRSLPSAVG
jgi:hypothetical protein